MFKPTPTARVTRELLPALATCAALSSSIVSSAAASEVRVRGRTEFSAIQVLPSEQGLRVQGVLQDDLGKPVADASIHLRQVDPSASLRVDACVPSTSPKAPAVARVEHDVLHTDPVGRFCGLVPADREGIGIEMVYAGGTLLQATRLQTTLTRLLSAVELDLGRAMLKFDLGKPTHTLRVATRPGAISPHATEPLPITLVLSRDAEEVPLGEPQAPVVGQSAVFVVESSKLPGPGPARITARFSGTRTISPASSSAVARITAGVTLSLAGEPPAGDPTAGLSFEVVVGSPAGAVPSGWVEARRSGEPVGIAEVNAGTATLSVRFDEARAGSVPLQVAYIPKEPWWVPGDVLGVELEVSALPPWQTAPWLLVLLGLVAVVLRSWWRPRRAEVVSRAARPQPLHSGRAEVVVLDDEPSMGGWHGHVLDAHDGTPVSGATVEVAIPGFSADTKPRRTTTDATGRFRLQWSGNRIPEGSTLRLEAAWHSTLQDPLPRRGHLRIAMVHRRRTLLQRLTQWAQRAGAPWHEPPEVTPGHVERQAEREHRADVVDWARSVQLGAYGAASPDADFERRVTEKEPRTRAR